MKRNKMQQPWCCCALLLPPSLLTHGGGSVVYGAVCAVRDVVHGVVYVVAAVAAASHKFPRLLIRCKKMCSAPHKCWAWPNVTGVPSWWFQLTSKILACIAEEHILPGCTWNCTNQMHQTLVLKYAIGCPHARLWTHMLQKWRNANEYEQWQIAKSELDHQKRTKLPTDGWGWTVPASAIANGCTTHPTAN
jgi:hypothetical protein